MRSQQTVNKNKKTITLRSLARELLFADANYITLILTIIISVSAIVLPYMLVGLVSDFVYQSAATAFLIGFEFLIASPMALGVIKVCCALREKRKDAIGELFFAFSSLGAYFKTLLLALIQIIKLAVELGIALLAVSVIEMLPFPRLSGVLIDVAIITVVISAVKLLTSRLYGTVYFALSGDRIKPIRAIAESWRYCKKDGKRSVLLRISFVPLILLSALPLGLPLLLYTVPYMLCSYTYYMSELESGRSYLESCVLPDPIEDSQNDNEITAEPEEKPNEDPENVGDNEIIENGDINNE